MTIRFEYLTSWIGPFEKIEKGTAKFLQENCSICLQDYLPKEVVQTLPCSHTFHHHCVQTMQKYNSHIVCPLDRQVIERGRITILGHEILFKHASLWIYHVIEKYQDVLMEYVKEIQENSMQSESCDEQIKTVVKRLNNFVEDYEKRVVRGEDEDIFFSIALSDIEEMLLRIEQKEEDIYLDFNLDEMFTSQWDRTVQAMRLSGTLLNNIPDIPDSVRRTLTSDIEKIIECIVPLIRLSRKKKPSVL